MLWSIGQTLSAVSKPPVRLTISQRTTVITEPLRDDGYPDYAEALDRMARQGITPDNNAAVLLVRAFGPGLIFDPEFFKRLGIEPLPEEGEYFVDYHRYVKTKDVDAYEAGFDAQQQLPPERDLWKQRNLALSGPWSEKDCPFVAGWLEANQKPLRLIVRASARPRYYVPPLASGEDPLAAVSATSRVVLFRGAQEALACRANLHIKKGQRQQAMNDLLACHRLARLVGAMPGLVDCLLSTAAENATCRGDLNLAHYGGITLRESRHYRSQLQALPSLPNFVDRVDRAERLFFADLVCCLSRKGFEDADRLMNAPAIDFSDEKALFGAFRSPLQPTLAEKAASTLRWAIGFDADAVLILGNSYYDRAVAALKLPTFAEQGAALRELEREIADLHRKRNNRLYIAGEILKGKPLRTVLSEKTAANLLSTMIPAIGTMLEAEHRRLVVFELTDVALALGAYRTDHGAYPETLAPLQPKYIDRLPVDRYCGAAVKYRREGDGYVLYTVGPNLKDDGGYDQWPLEPPPENKRSQHTSSRADDVGIRVPPR